MPARAVAVVTVLHRTVFVKELAIEPQTNRLVRRLEEQTRAAVPLFGQTRCQIGIARLARKERLCGISHTLPSFSTILRLLQKFLHFSLVRKVRALPIVQFRRLSFLFSRMLQGKACHLMGIQGKSMRGDCRQGREDEENSCERKNAQKVMRRSAPSFPQHCHAPPSHCRLRKPSIRHSCKTQDPFAIIYHILVQKSRVGDRIFSFQVSRFTR